MNKVVKLFLLSVFLYGAQTLVHAQSKLPDCNGAREQFWNECIGKGFIHSTEVGLRYVGEYKNGKKSGWGTAFFRDGRKYVGDFYENAFHGEGTLFNANGIVLSSGIWAWNTFQGEGRKENNNIEESIRSSLPKCPATGLYDNCFGIETYGSGNKYVGEFKDGNYHGKGVLLSLKGEIIKSGLWIDGELKAQQNNLVSISPNTLDNSKLERDRLSAEVDTERKRRQELEEQLKVAQQRPVASQTANNSSMGKRIALVVGNANYKVRPLKNSRNDADDVSRSLKATGFDVIDLRDASLPQMRTAVRQFGDRLINNDVGLVYYSGHGVEVKGRNYFIPVNADIQREDEIADQGLDVSLILEKMSTAGKGVNILIVDACRDDPFGRSFRSSSRGLANMDAPRGTIIAYATSPGKVASDGDPRERNSPYTKHLVKAMQSPNKPIEQVFKEVRRAVQDETKNQQTPWENTSLSGDFFFRVQR